ncbi:hypothetical protein XH98_10985 [Bradyrhizobium sp. CCBAU 51745]|uniref:hypothetical protein n=1 Tax=Bradyrhizobium sp. CCBAU 51745 TaxID=1325099 RepID=UPI00230572CD|nr:hypothetical protein [Bradyrhizobium sp. CCBAU 51745]MDA9439643.1 hypothetical protein [Bradyrhizobium sp. CCBAU 51745]
MIRAGDESSVGAKEFFFCQLLIGRSAPDPAHDKIDMATPQHFGDFAVEAFGDGNVDLWCGLDQDFERARI